MDKSANKSDIFTEIENELNKLKNEEYAAFQAKLTPDKPREYFLGVKTPLLKNLAKRLYRSKQKSELDEFLRCLPHEYFEENNLHGFLICEIKDFNECLNKLNDFLPYVDNWATCDQTVPAALKKDKVSLKKQAFKWLDSKKTYIVRYGIAVFMRYFLGDDFSPEYADAVAKIKSDEYYVMMMQAWYFATALCKNKSEILPFFSNGKLSGFVLKKAIQKSLESYRIDDQTKEYLKQLRKNL